MSELNEVSLAIGRLQSSVDTLVTSARDHSDKLEDLKQHVNHEAHAMDQRVEKLEEDKAQRHARSSLILKILGGMSAFGLIAATLLTVDWSHLFKG